MQQKYTFIRDGKPENVHRESWRWVAEYYDGSELKQFDEATGLFHQFSEINQADLKAFKMVHDELLDQVLVFEPGMKLVHFYKRYVLDNNTRRVTWYIFGFERGYEKRLTAITPQEVITVSNINTLTVQ